MLAKGQLVLSDRLLGAILTVVWGALLLKEHGLRERLAATAVMVIGGLLIAL